MTFQDILQMVKDNLFCHICGQYFEAHNVALAGLKDNIIVFQAYCDRGHMPSNALIKAFAPYPLPMADSLNYVGSEKPMTIDDVLDLKNTIVNFDGDFAGSFANLLQ